MIQVSNRKEILNLPFEEYLKIDRKSNSTLKNANNYKPFKSSQKIVIGKLVDNILTGNFHDYSNPEYKKAIIIAEEIEKTFGSVIKRFESQVSLTADFTLDGITLQVKGRPDWRIKKRCIIDLKVTDVDENRVDYLLKDYGYETQTEGYKLLEGCEKAFILFFFKNKSKAKLFPVSGNHNQWEEWILMHGDVI